MLATGDIRNCPIGMFLFGACKTFKQCNSLLKIEKYQLQIDFQLLLKPYGTNVQRLGKSGSIAGRHWRTCVRVCYSLSRYTEGREGHVREFATVSAAPHGLQPPFPALHLTLQLLRLRPLSGAKLMTLPNLHCSLLVALNSHSIWLSLGPHTETKELLRPSMELTPVIPVLQGHKQEDQSSVPARATWNTVTLNKAGVVIRGSVLA